MYPDRTTPVCPSVIALSEDIVKRIDAASQAQDQSESMQEQQDTNQEEARNLGQSIIDMISVLPQPRTKTAATMIKVTHSTPQIHPNQEQGSEDPIEENGTTLASELESLNDGSSGIDLDADLIL